MVLCITPQNFRPIAEILKELEWERRPSKVMVACAKCGYKHYYILDLENFLHTGAAGEDSSVKHTLGRITHPRQNNKVKQANLWILSTSVNREIQSEADRM